MVFYVPVGCVRFARYCGTIRKKMACVHLGLKRSGENNLVPRVTLGTRLGENRGNFASGF